MTASRCSFTIARTAAWMPSAAPPSPRFERTTDWRNPPMPKRKIVTVTVDDATPGTLEPIGPDRFQFIAPVAFGKQFSYPDPVILRGFDEVGFSNEVGHFG